MAKTKSKAPRVNVNVSTQASTTVNAGISEESFKTLLDLQSLSLQNLQSIRKILEDNSNSQQLESLQDLIIIQTQKDQSIFKGIHDTLKSIGKSLKQSAPSISSSGPVLNSNSSTAVVAQNKEDKNETQQLEDKKLNLLEKIEENTRGMGGSRIKGGKGIDIGIGGKGIGGLLTGLAGVIGSVVGAIIGKLKAIKYFFNLLGGEALVLKIQKAIAGFAVGVSMTFDLVKIAISEKFSGVIKIFDSVIDSIKSIFSVDKEGKIGKLLSSITGTISKIMAPFIEAFVEIQKFFAGPGDKIGKLLSSITGTISKIMAPFIEAFVEIQKFFAGPAGKAFTFIKEIFVDIGAKFGKFAALFKGVAKLIGKIFPPFAIIMTIWDTVKGAIEGFEKDGIIGGISGAIKGFFNTLIYSLMNMIKDAAAWVAGIFGFDEVKDVLDSIDFEKTFSDLVDTCFKPIKAVRDWIINLFDQLKNLEIPKFEFTIPIINKTISLGPYKPFETSVEGAEAGSTTGGSETSTPAKPNIAPSPINSSPTAQTVAQTSSEVSAMKETPMGGTTSNVVAPTVNNNMKQTQIAKISTPVRTEDSSVDRYFSSRLSFT